MTALPIARSTYRQAIRNKVHYSVIFGAFLVVSVSAFFGAVSIGDQVEVIKSFGLFVISFFGSLTAVISGAVLLHHDIKHKTAYNVLSKPVTRSQFLFGKLLGLLFTSYTIVGILGAVVIAFVAVFEGRPDPLLIQGVFFALLEVTVVSALAIFFSAIVVTPTLAGLFTLGAYIGGKSVSALQFFLHGNHETPPALSVLARALETILPHLNLLTPINQLVHGIPVSATSTFVAVVYTLAYSCVLFVLAALVFQRRELE